MKRPGQQRLTIVPSTLRAANAYVDQYHRHHGKRQGHKFSVAVADEQGVIRGVAIVGRPNARELDDGFTLEVLRVATDGFPNACSALYSAARKVAFAMGYKEVKTYTLLTEPGTSLKALKDQGWKDEGEAGGGTWDRPNIGRNRTDKHPTETKRRWSCKAENTQ